MHNALYFTPAKSNLKKNRAIYLPYLLANVLIVSMYYILTSIRSMMQTYETTQGSNTDLMLRFCTVVAVIMAFIILFYVNSFVIRQRKKEIGLYCVLGMEKRHLSVMMLWEVVLTSLGGIVGGIVSGALFSQLAFLVFLALLRIPSDLRFEIPLGAVGNTCAVFGVLYLLVLCYNLLSILRTSPISFLQGAKEGEREPKVKKIPAVLGVIFLATGYGLALFADGIYETIKVFLPAVLLVIFATYFLFLAGSIALLKWMKRRERFYYRPKNFITVSGMLYRMKQNAAGLATICILSTAVIVSVSTSFSLYLGEEDILKLQFPRDYHASCILEKGEEETADLQAGIEHQAKENGVAMRDDFGYKQLWMAGLAAGEPGEFTLSDGEQISPENLYIFAFLTEDDYNKNTGADLNLGDDEVAVYEKEEESVGQSLKLDELSWKVKSKVEDPGVWNQALYLTETHYMAVIVPDMSALQEIRDVYNEKYAGTQTGYRVITYEYYYNIEGTRSQKADFIETLRDTLIQYVEHPMAVGNVELSRTDYYERFGSFLFIGLFLSILFLLAVSLIIYYKQITEGLDDRERFQIMKKVGMTDDEIRSTIRRQILQVFFLPLAMAALHTAASFPALVDLMRAMNLINQEIFVRCTIGVVLAFAVVYFIIYTITSHTYYKKVQQNE